VVIAKRAVSDRTLTEHRTGAILAALVLVVLVTRGWVMYAGGIWADEGLVFSILAIPSLGGMIEFLRLHESHPPLFYLLARGWSAVLGGTDATLLALPLVLSLLLVPVVYLAGKAMFGRSTALLAATLVALSPALTEHASQLRPYGLLPVLVTASAVSLLRGLELGGRREWVVFVVSTALLLYTHHWTWLVGAGLFLASIDFCRRLPSPRREAALRETIVAAVAIAALYAPWAGAFLHQARETGHVALTLEGVELLLFALLGALTVPYMLAFGSVPGTQLPFVLFSLVATAVTVAILYWRGALREAGLDAGPQEGDADWRRRRRFLLVVTAGATVFGIVLSPRSNMLLDRCVAMLSPVVILAMSSWLIERHARSAMPLARRLVVAGGVFIFWLSVSNILALSKTVRSNALEVAAEISSAARPTDLLIVAPEWYAPSFNHYFAPSLEQVDYPHEGRSGLLRFDGVRARHADTVALARLRRRILAAGISGRRVWLVTARRYLRFVDEDLPRMSDAQKAKLTSVVRVQQARDALVAQFGAPDTTHFVRTASTRYEELLPLLFSPPAVGR
jgi:hypothetical protein